ncbi:hypothetical protein Pan97_06350 [Bremerella volcania]|uniref:Uncharacterized protein n=1 Tax=Bremerella volcania TaxID=2527984 RepID=A0A518C333_9BACT|nr:hypothetical protein [Bremerella volcania]QDU73637.1 hypothetical protein Pan97_06350 [Bremerella volcania]
MSSSPAQPKTSDQRSTERRSQVVVRAGRHYVCSACGTWVEIPADVVGQWVIAVDSSPQPDQPSQGDPPQEDAEKEGASVDKPQVPANTPRWASSWVSPNGGGGRATSASCFAPITQRPKPARPRRPKTPLRDSYTGQTIDGLIVPAAAKLDRALSWVTFHLTVLDRQGTEFNRLRKLLKKQRGQHGRAATDHAILDRADLQKHSRVPRPSLLGRARRSSVRARQSDAHAHVSMASQAIGVLTRWHRKSATPSCQRRLRTWKRIQGRGPP